VSSKTDNPGAVDQGLIVLTQLLQLHGIGVDPAQVRHRFGGVPIGVSEMLRYARQTGLKARVYTTTFARLDKTPLPGIAALRDGGFLLLGKVGDGKVLVQSPSAPRPQLMTQAELEAVWDGRIVLIARRAGLTDLARRFDITWFLGAIVKYRSLLGEVLAASFFLQLFALATPLIFQVVIDKVLVHRSSPFWRSRYLKLFSAPCAATFFPTRQTGLTSSLEPGSSATFLHCPSLTSRQDASAIQLPAFENWKISEVF
jgi:subfamily B ATP-binding cassette protein HlyB/CyaB